MVSEWLARRRGALFDILLGRARVASVSSRLGHSVAKLFLVRARVASGSSSLGHSAAKLFLEGAFPLKGVSGC